MENRTSIKIDNTTATFYEAVVKSLKFGNEETLVAKTLEELQKDVNVWLRSGRWELKTADKVERVICRLTL